MTAPNQWHQREFTIYDSQGRVIARPETTHPDYVKNMALIRSAPELLEALQDAMQYLPPAYVHDQTATRIRAKAAIARARGER